MTNSTATKDETLEAMARAMHDGPLCSDDDFDEPEHPASVKWCFDMAEAAYEAALPLLRKQHFEEAWQPIKTAPMGRHDDPATFFIGMRVDKHPSDPHRNRMNVATCYRNEQGAYEWWGGGISPTHWMPLPEPSTAIRASGEDG